MPIRFAFRKLLLAVFSLTLAWGTPAQAQSSRHFTIGEISSKEECKYFLETEYQRAAVATPWLYASQTSWRSWWVKDCVSRFQTMRSSLEAALASTGRFTVGPGGYRISVTIQDVSGGGPAPNNPPVGDRGYAFSKTGIYTSFTVTVTDSTGKVVHGGLATKVVETGARINADGTYAATSMTGDAVYGVLQNEVALAIARIVAFNIVPLAVTETDGDRIALNYGAPLLKLGATINVPTGSGLRSYRYSVVSAANGSAIAEVEGDVDTSAVRVGTVATYAEEDDPAANGRRYDRVKLP